MNNIKIIAHRSGPDLYPEQTVKSAKAALADGADLVEIDIRLTADGEVAVCHDSNAERVFGINREIDEMSREEYIALRHRENPEYSAHILGDYLAAQIKPLLIHIKEEGAIMPALALLDKYGYNDGDVVFGVSALSSVELIKKERSKPQLLAFLPSYERKNEFIAAGVDYVRVWESWLDKYNVVFDFPTWIMTDALGVGYTQDKKLTELLKLNINGILINQVSIRGRFLD